MNNIPLSPRKKHIKWLLLPIFLLLWTTLNMLVQPASVEAAVPPQATKGFQDLSGLKGEEIISLEGEWGFYWKKLLAPAEVNEAEPDLYARVPSSWTKYKLSDGTSPTKAGYATYHLKVQLPRAGEVWTIEVPSMSISYSMWVNGELLLQNGKVGTERSEAEYKKEKRLISFYIPGDQLELVIQASSYIVRRGGFTQTLKLGEAGTSNREHAGRTAYETFLVGALFIMAIYHFGLYLIRRKEPSPLFFGGFCLIIALRSVLVGETTAYHLVSHLDAIMAIRLEYLSLSLSVISFALFLKRVYPNEMSSGVLKVMGVICAAYSVMILLTQPQIFTFMLPYFQSFIMISITYGFIVFVLATYKRRSGAAISTAGALMLTITIFNDILYNQGLIETGYYVSLGLFVFIIAQSFVLGLRFSKAFSSSEELARKLLALNNSLEEKVRERTGELEEANRTLMEMTLVDGLTGIANRRHFDDTWLRIAGCRSEEHQCFSLLLVDIDCFKTYNDTYGHLAGDECLKQVAAVLQEEAQLAGGLAARYGGEEFAIIIGGSYEKAEELAARLVAKVYGLRIPHMASSAAEYVTVSCGVVTAEEGSSCPAPETLFHSADEALYLAKQAGRNRYEHHNKLKHQQRPASF